MSTQMPQMTYEGVLKRQPSNAAKGGAQIHTLKDRRLQGKSMVERIIQIQQDVWVAICEAGKDQLIS